MKGGSGGGKEFIIVLVEYEMVSIVGKVIILTSDGNPFGMWPRYKRTIASIGAWM